jgi:hypothetical protein
VVIIPGGPGRWELGSPFYSNHTHCMSKRLQVVLDEDEYREIQRLAQRHRMTVSEWVRQSLRRARQDEPVVDAGRKLDAVRSTAGHDYPVADMEQMLEEIERGYVGGTG